MGTMFTPQVILLTVLVFFLLVGIHEWGHFIFAKRAGILIREFAIGFGFKIFSFKRGETRYTLRLFPVGGFVRMAGEDPEFVDIAPGQRVALGVRNHQVERIYLDRYDERPDAVRGVVEDIDLEHKLTIRLTMDDGEERRFVVHPQAHTVQKGKETQIAPFNRQFGGKTLGQRAMSIFAGPLMNFILAFLLFLAYAWMSGVPEHIQLNAISPDSAAQAAGLQKGDVVLSVNGTDVGTDVEAFVKMIEQSADKKMQWEIRRSGETRVINVTPKLTDGVGKVGIVPSFETRRATIGETLHNGGQSMANYTGLIFEGLKKLVTLQFKLDDLGGPVRMVEVTGQAASMGIATLTLWAAILSLYLGIFNLIPFPALDGSRLIFIGLEAVRGKPVDPNRESMVHFIGFAMMMLLMIAVTYNDILRLFKG